MACYTQIPSIPYPVDVFTGHESGYTKETFNGRNLTIKEVELRCQEESNWNTFLAVLLIGSVIGLAVGLALIFN